MLATANTGKIRRDFGKNADEWTERVEISKEEIPGRKCSNVWLYTDLLQALKGERLSSCVLTRCGLQFLRPQLPTAGKRTAETRTGTRSLETVSSKEGRYRKHINQDTVLSENWALKDHHNGDCWPQPRTGQSRRQRRATGSEGVSE